jgi:putative nucleotidyltransferase with HDIG domain
MLTLLDAGTALKAKDPWSLLFVDDETSILLSLNRLFRPHGYRIFTAPSGAAGLEILQKEKIDLIISDMRMPEMDGAAFLEQVLRNWPDTVRLLLTGYADMKSTIAAINKGHIYRYLQKPWEDDDVVLTVQHALEKKHLQQERQRLEELTRRQNEELAYLNATLEAKVAERTSEVLTAVRRLQAVNKSLQKNYVTTVKIFASMVEMREAEKGGHSRRVAEQAQSLASKMGASESDAQDVLFAGLLHDIGKIALSDDLFEKPFNSLLAHERALVIKHPTIGESLLMALDAMQETAKLIRAHHERHDGKGYPDGLKGDAIPLGARILAVVNDYDSLQHAHLTPERLTALEAQYFLKNNRGSRYDPDVVDAFIELLEKESLEAKIRPEVHMPVEALRAGMVLSRDLVTKDQIMLLSKGHMLDDRLIAKLNNINFHCENLVVYVCELS